MRHWPCEDKAEYFSKEAFLCKCLGRKGPFRRIVIDEPGEINWDKILKGTLKECGLYPSDNEKLLRGLKHGHAMFVFAF